MAAAFPCDRSAAVFYEFIEQPQKQRRLCCIQEYDLKVKARWLAGGGDPARSYWWHVTEIMPDHLRPSPVWKKQGEDLQLAKKTAKRLFGSGSRYWQSVKRIKPGSAGWWPRSRAHFKA
jgi:hypothetical protein